MKWDPRIFYHTAATVVILSDNTTNVTRISTIPGSSFAFPTSISGIVRPVDGSVISTDFAGTEYSL